VAGAKGKVLVGMSGGVDSAVAAALLLEQGWEVTGAFVCMGRAADAEGGSGCCSPQDAADARRVAGLLGVDLYVLDATEGFERVIAAFAAEYAAGRTPNPCIGCNRDIKFGRLLQRARDLGFDAVATGHYARVVQRGGAPALARARAVEKDQSYVLFELPRAALGRLVLPLGEVESKAAVRARARALGLPVHDKPDSQEICFVPDGDHAAVLAARAPSALTPGDVLDETGRVVGRHQGYGRFTVGQRRGLGVAAGARRYVTAVDAAAATVTIGPREATRVARLSASRATWHAELEPERAAQVQVRSGHGAAPARLAGAGLGRFEVIFDAPIDAAAPGQAAVAYDGDVLLGGGWIDRTERPAAADAGPAGP
jgi:tRNA-uridine 2-sulfurtransferase